jgi:hypothetical protein
MVISRPCNHPDAAPRDGYIRGNYESVEFIREIPINRGPKKSASTTNLPAQATSGRNRSGSLLGKEAILRNAKKNCSAPMSENTPRTMKKASASENDLTRAETRVRGKTISFDKSRGFEAKGEDMDVPREDNELENNPVEWIMITRSDPGGSVPRFMVERGTPGGIVADASKFLNWACARDIEDFDSDNETLKGEEQDGSGQKSEHKHHHNYERDLHNYETNGHLAGIEEVSAPTDEQLATNEGGLYEMVAGVAGVAGGYIAAHAPAMISNHLPGYQTEETNKIPRRDSVSSIGSESSIGSFASALENNSSDFNDASSIQTAESAGASKVTTTQDKELQKLEEKKRKLEEKLSKEREKEMSKKSEDSAKEEEAIRKAEEKHKQEVKKQEEKYKKEVEKLEKKREKEERKAEERRRKNAEKDEKIRLMRELEEVKAENSVLRKEKEILRRQVGDLQAENTALAARVGKLGTQGEEVLRDVRAEVGRSGRLRASSLKGLTRTTSFKSSVSSEKDKENGQSVKP